MDDTPDRIMTETIDELLDHIDQLEDELERVKAQRDKAVENLERFCGQDVLTVTDVDDEVTK